MARRGFIEDDDAQKDPIPPAPLEGSEADAQPASEGRIDLTGGHSFEAKIDLTGRSSNQHSQPATNPAIWADEQNPRFARRSDEAGPAGSQSQPSPSYSREPHPSASYLRPDLEQRTTFATGAVADPRVGAQRTEAFGSDGSARAVDDAADQAALQYRPASPVPGGQLAATGFSQYRSAAEPVGSPTDEAAEEVSPQAGRRRAAVDDVEPVRTPQTTAEDTAALHAERDAGSAPSRRLLVVAPQASEEDEPSAESAEAGKKQKSKKRKGAEKRGERGEQQSPSAAVVAARRCAALVLGVVLLAVGASALLWTLPSQGRPQPEAVPVLTSVAKVCPGAGDGRPGILYAAVPNVSDESAISIRHLVDGAEQAFAGEPIPMTDTSLITPKAGSTALGGVISQEDQHTFWAGCRVPGTDLFLQSPTAEGAELVLINPDQAPAVLDLTMSSEDGDASTTQLRSMSVSGRSATRVKLADYVQTKEAVGIRVRVTNGRVYSTLRIANREGGDYVKAVQAGQHLLVPAVPAGSSNAKLIVTNPGTTRLTVRLNAYGPGGNYELPNMAEIVVDAQRTQSFDMSAVVGGDPMSLELTADNDFTAAVAARAGNDFTIISAHSDTRYLNAKDLMSAVPGEGVVQVANRSTKLESSVHVQWGAGQAPVDELIPPGSIIEIPVPSGARMVRVSSDQLLTGGVVVKRSGGVAVAPLELGSPKKSVQLEPDPHLH